MDTERIDLTADELSLDIENPRIGSVLTQSEALSSIIQLDAKHFKTMMQSIKENGLDPGDSFYVIADEEDDASYVVVDGNRRLAAIKVLLTPTFLKGTSLPATLIGSLTKLAAGFNASSVSELRCVRFANRSDANEWILRRHGRGMDGEGRIAWGPLEIQRFQKDRTILDIIDFVEKNSTFSNEEWQRIKGQIEGSPSILRRFIDSKVGRERLGISVTEYDGGKKIPKLSKSPEFVLSVLSRIFSDISNELIDTRSYNKASDITKYFDELPLALRSGKSAPPQDFASAQVKGGSTRPRQPAPASAGAAAADAAAKEKTSKPVPIRKTLAPPRHTFAQPKSEKTIQLLREASKVSLKDTPLACAFIFRAFIQQTVDFYMTENGIPFRDGDKQLELSVRAERVFDHLISSRKSSTKEIGFIKRMFAKGTDPASVKALNDYHHDTYQIPTADVLRNTWNSSVGLFIAVYGKA